MEIALTINDAFVIPLMCDLDAKSISFYGWGWMQIVLDVCSLSEETRYGQGKMASIAKSTKT